MPPALPEQIRGLPQDRGRPVPYINVWDGEKPESSWVIRYDPLVERPAIFTHGRPGRGRPDFTRQAPQRQRECMMRGRCQVCHGENKPGTALLVVSQTSMQLVELVEGISEPVPVFTEPWLCPPCARFAIEHCPALVRQRRDDALFLIRPTKWKLVTSVGWVEGRLEEYSRRVQPAMWVKIAVTDSDEVTT